MCPSRPAGAARPGGSRTASGTRRSRSGRSCRRRRGPRDRDQPRVVGGHHRLAGAGHQDLQAADVGLVHLGPVRVRDATPAPRTRPCTAGPGSRPYGQVPAVGLGPAQVGLQHGAGRREVPAELGAGCRSVESVVVWSSMSSVTVVPARSAAAQISRACSSAILSPSPGSAWPTADSLRLTSASGVRPSAASRSSTDRYAFAAAAACSEIGGVLAEVVEGRPSAPSATSRRVAATASSPGRPGHEPVHHVAGQRRGLDQMLHRGVPRRGQDQRAHALSLRASRPRPGAAG